MKCFKKESKRDKVVIHQTNLRSKIDGQGILKDNI